MTLRDLPNFEKAYGGHISTLACCALVHKFLNQILVSGDEGLGKAYTIVGRHP